MTDQRNEEYRQRFQFYLLEAAKVQTLWCEPHYEATVMLHPTLGWIFKNPEER